MTAAPPVHLFEEHSSTLPVWWQQPGGPHTVVYLDAHLDLQQTDAAKIEALGRCRSLAAVQALEAPHHLDTSPRYAFGIENFLYPAHRLGLIERLVWVAPPHVPRGYSRDLLAYAQQMDGVSFEELTGFSRAGERSLRGRLLGLDITICDVGDLARLALPADYCLDIDIDYFVTVPGDTLWADPGDTIRTLLETLGAPRVATVSRAVGSGFTPVQHRFVGDYAAAALTGDDSAAEHYATLYRAAVSLEGGDRDGAESRCRTALAARPDCAAARVLLARALDDVEQARALMRRAAALDPACGFDLSREACAFRNRRKPIDPARVRSLVQAHAGMHDDHHAYADIAMARLYADAGMPGRAWALLKQRPQAGQSGEVWLAVAVAVLEGPEPRRAAPLLARAREHDATRTSALLHLGDLALRAGEAAKAKAFYTEAAERAPAWQLPLEQLRRCCEALGERAPAARLATRLNKREQVLAALVGD